MVSQLSGIEYCRCSKSANHPVLAPPLPNGEGETVTGGCFVGAQVQKESSSRVASTWHPTPRSAKDPDVSTKEEARAPQ
jgi:hypothetical protein